MAKIKFHSETAKNLEPSDKSEEYYAINFSPGNPGSLALRVSPKGKKVWVVVYRLPDGHRPQKMSIGGYPVMSFTKAKKAAVKLLAKIADGYDPKRDKQDRLEAPTFEILCELYLKHHAVSKKDGGHADKLKLNNHRLNTIRNMKVQDIRRRHIIDILDIIKATAPTAANRYKALLSKLFNFAIRRALVSDTFSNPASNIDKPHKEVSRDRVFSADEIANLWSAFDTMRDDLSEAMKVLLLTGQRLTEITGLRWNEVDFEAGLICLPGERTKNGRTHTLPMTGAVRELLANIETEGDFVFPAAGKTGHVMLWTKDRVAIRKESGIADWRPHDMRGTMTTLMGRVGISRFIQDRITNHVDGSIGGVYDRHDYLDQMRDALLKWEVALFRMIGEPFQAEILQIRQAG